LADDLVDCSLSDEDRGPCDAAVAIKLDPVGRVRWGEYACPVALRARPAPRLRRLRRRDYTCQLGDASCPPPIFGVLGDRCLVPWG